MSFSYSKIPYIENNIKDPLFDTEKYLKSNTLAYGRNTNHHIFQGPVYYIMVDSKPMAYLLLNNGGDYFFPLCGSRGYMMEGGERNKCFSKFYNRITKNQKHLFEKHMDFFLNLNYYIP